MKVEKIWVAFGAVLEEIHNPEQYFEEDCLDKSKARN